MVEAHVPTQIARRPRDNVGDTPGPIITSWSQNLTLKIISSAM